jgi:hypothetical protein
MLGLPEKIGLVGGQNVHHSPDLGPAFVVCQVFKVTIETEKLQMSEPLYKPGFDQFFLALMQIYPRNLIDKPTDFIKLLRRKF